MMTKEQFEQFWSKEYEDTIPIGHILRNHFYDNRWFRVHSLPNSKRYADNEAEMKIILNRQNRLINDLVGENKEYVLLIYIISESSRFEKLQEFNDIVLLESLRLDQLLPDEYEQELYLHLGFINKKWQNGSIDEYLALIADEGKIIALDGDSSYGMLIIDYTKTRIIAPYDGGVDIIMEDIKERELCKEDYREWLSHTESGL